MYYPPLIFPATEERHIKQIIDLMMTKHSGLMVVDLRKDKTFPAAIGVVIDPILMSATLHKLDPQAVKNTAVYL